ncbi:MAG: hypothetical protein H7A33_08385 [Deltaproteobacteria bacterium]|nr:hypothetical protein [Deltaproteobacteria bacterium]
MKDSLKTLLKCAEIERKIQELSDETQEIPQITKSLAGDLSALSSDLENKKQELLNLTSRLSELQDLLTEKRSWIEEREQNISTLKTHKEFQGAQKEISLARKAIKDAEEEIAKLSPSKEALESGVKEQEESTLPKIEEIKNDIAEKKAHFEKIDQLIAEERRKLDELSKEISDKKMARHFNTIRQRTSPAISLIENGHCMECGTKVLPQTLNQLHRGEAMQICNRCKRIIYFDHMIEDNAADAAQDAKDEAQS